MTPENSRRSAGRPCSVCRHAGRDQIEIGLLAGESVSLLSHRFGVSTDSIYRHTRAHLAPAARTALDGPGAMPPSVIASRVLEIADDLRTSRRNAQNSGRRADAIRAADAELKALTTLSDRLGVTDVEILAELDNTSRLITALGTVIRRDPAIADVLAAELRDAGHHSEASELDLVATSARTALPTTPTKGLPT